MFGDIIKAGTSIIGGFMNKESAEDAQYATNQNLANQMAMQKQFAKNGIRWRVEDARKAGIHPLYAIGANTASYTPSSVAFQGDSSLGNAFAAAGQDIGRAINSTRTAPERADAFTKSMQAITLQNAGLDLEIKKATLASQIARNRDNATPPGPGGLLPPTPFGTANLPVDKMDKITPLQAGGATLARNPGWSDGQTFEDRWGEWGGSLAGLAVMAADLLRDVQYRFPQGSMPWDSSYERLKSMFSRGRSTLR